MEWARNISRNLGVPWSVSWCFQTYWQCWACSYRKHSLTRSKQISQVKPRLPYEERNPGQSKCCLEMRGLMTGCWRRGMMNIKCQQGLERVPLTILYWVFVAFWLATTVKELWDGCDLAVKETVRVPEWWKGSTVNGHHSCALLYFLSPLSNHSDTFRDHFQEGTDLFCIEPCSRPTPHSSFSCPGPLWCDGLAWPWELPGHSSMNNLRVWGNACGASFEQWGQEPLQKVLCNGSPRAVVSLKRTPHCFIDFSSCFASLDLPCSPAPWDHLPNELPSLKPLS